jgi:drug/metabolite transporter (DMT)-like permease
MTHTAEPSILRPAVLIPFLIVTLIWGTTWFVIRDQLAVVPPAWSVTYRFLTSGLIMIGVAAFTRQPLRLDARSAGFVALFGVAQFVFNFNFVYQAERHITSGLVATVFALLFVPNAVLAQIFLGQKVTSRFWMGSVVSIAGLALLFINEARGDEGESSATIAGIALTLCGVLSASVANVMQAGETARRLPMPVMLGWGMLFGAGVDAAYAWTTSGPPVFEWRLGYIAGIAYLGIFASAIAFSLYFKTIRDIGPAKAAYSSVLIPVIAMLISTLFEGYRWTMLAGAGGALAMAGMVIALSARSRSS